MKKIKFNQKKYVYPLIFLPILIMGFSLYKDFSGASQSNVVVQEEGLKTQVIQPQEKQTELTSKLDEYRRNRNGGTNFSGLSGLGNESRGDDQYDDLYTEQEMRSLDSLRKSSILSPNQQTPNLHPRGGYVSQSNNAGVDDDPINKLLNAQAKINSNQQSYPDPKEESLDPVYMMKKQYELIDSIERARDPEMQAQAAREEQARAMAEEQRALDARTLYVTKANQAKRQFNTIKREDSNSFIKAIIDEDNKVYAGGRMRLRLLEDIEVGGDLIKKGTYLYAIVNGFSEQRITLNISSILKGDKILPINLDIYDNDGMKGLYVPASAFREFTKQLGSQSMQGIQLQSNDPANQQQMLMSTIQRAFQSTSQAISKAIRSNKARLKYGTHIFLIDSRELNQRKTQR